MVFNLEIGVWLMPPWSKVSSAVLDKHSEQAVQSLTATDNAASTNVRYFRASSPYCVLLPLGMTNLKLIAVRLKSGPKTLL